MMHPLCSFGEKKQNAGVAKLPVSASILEARISSDKRGLLENKMGDHGGDQTHI